MVNDSSDIWNDDEVEIGIDTDNNGEKSVPPDHQYILASDGRQRDFGTRNVSFPYGLQETANGWTLEIAIPVSDLGSGTLTAGRILGFNWALADDDYEGAGDDTLESWLVWHGTRTNHPAFGWGQLLLSDVTVVLPTATPTATAPPTDTPTSTTTPTATLVALQRYVPLFLK